MYLKPSARAPAAHFIPSATIVLIAFIASFNPSINFDPPGEDLLKKLKKK
jgi:hypothetical protein